jgi:putative redox protein
MGERDMSTKDNDFKEESLKGYKEKTAPAAKTVLTWNRDLVFLGSTQRGYEIEFDALAEEGCMPMEALLLSLAGCMAIDVVTILQKMRLSLTAFRAEIVGERNPTPPQYYTAIEIVLHIAGKNIDAQKVDRAVSLSRNTYCSVYNSLRKDTDLKVRYVLNETSNQ